MKAAARRRPTSPVTVRVGAIVEQCWHRVPGGTATSTVRSLEALSQRSDLEMIGVAAAHRNPPGSFAVPPVEVCHMGLPRTALYEAWHRTRRPRIQTRTGPLDVVHATGGVIPPAGDAKLVATVHDLAFLRYPEYFSERGAAFMGRALALAKLHADMVLVPSLQTLQDCVSQGFSEERLRVVPWGVSTRYVSGQDRAALRTRYSLPARYLLWVGTAEPRKNLKTLIAAVAHCENPLPLLLVGPSGWGVDVSELLSFSSVDGSTVDVRHLGPVPGDDLAGLYDMADVFVYPSLMEGFGMPVLEAMAQGTAVVTSAGTATGEVAGSAGVLIDPTNVESITRGIDSLVGDDEFRQTLGAAAAEQAESMTWERTASGIAAAYQAVLE